MASSGHESASGTVTTSYTYDASGIRLSQDDGTDKTLTPVTNYTEVYDGQGTLTDVRKSYTAGGTLLATVQDSGGSATERYAHTDHLTGTSLMTSSTGTVDQLLDYTPFGSIRVDEKSGTFSEKRKYAGHEFDEGTGLSYMKARYYDPELGRFISQDPLSQIVPELFLVMPRQLNLYSYVMNNPLRYVDPTGLTTEIRDDTNEVTNVIDDGSTAIFSYPYVDGERAYGPPVHVGNTPFWDTFKKGAIIHVGEDKTNELYNEVKSSLEPNFITGLESRSGKRYDIKQTWHLEPGDGYLFEDHYFTIRDMGNILAGINASMGKVEFDDFQRMSGAVHQETGLIGLIDAYLGSSYGSAPLYGEEEVQHRASFLGYHVYSHLYRDR